jgi:hypothetical protein
VQPFLDGLRQYLRTEHAEVLRSIAEKKELSPELFEALRTAVQMYHGMVVVDAQSVPAPPVPADGQASADAEAEGS